MERISGKGKRRRGEKRARERRKCGLAMPPIFLSPDLCLQRQEAKVGFEVSPCFTMTSRLERELGNVFLLQDGMDSKDSGRCIAFSVYPFSQELIRITGMKG